MPIKLNKINLNFIFYFLQKIIRNLGGGEENSQT